MQHTAIHPGTAMRQTPTPALELMHLSPGHIHHIASNGQMIFVVRGRAWISVAAKDHVLRPGDVLALSADQNDAMISALEAKPVIYAVRDAA